LSDRANIYLRRKQFDLALADYNKAIEINPKIAEIFLNRGGLYFATKQYDLAIADCSKAQELSPNDARVFEGRSLAYEQKGDGVQALADFAKAIELNPQNGEPHWNRAQLYYNEKQYDKAQGASFYRFAFREFSSTLDLTPGFIFVLYGRRGSHQ
jgi:tetratricopeptide (TPR) repeat protein